MREAENIREVEKLFTSHSSLFTFWMGFIFWPKSGRFVSERPDYLPTGCKRIGVFVDADTETMKEIAEYYALDIVQLHGHESPEQLSQLSSLVPHLSLVKAFNIATAADLEATKHYEGVADYFLFDTRATMAAGTPAGSVLPGGTGAQFDWRILADYDGETPFLLSGGIGPDDAERVKSFLISPRSPLTSKKCIGIDLNSRFETAPGHKDINQLKAFIKQLKS